ncbi:MAG: helix-turn-helix transcriptional regulator [Clostridia bacterium]|nr:helix-turn-helix transcriptional regulator [Clostridia bacterium]
MDSNKPIKLTGAKYFDRDMFYDIITHYVSEDYPLHWHDFYEFEYIRSGHAVQIINGKEYDAVPGTAALLSPVDFHCYKNVSPDDPLVIYNIKFSDLILPAEVRACLCTLHQPLYGLSWQVKPIFDRLHEEYNSDEYGRDQYIMAGIIQLCVLLLRSGREVGNAVNAGEGNAHSLIQEAVLYIRNHYRSSITVEEVAKEVHLTPNYFSEYFKKQTGVKFSSYVQKLRLEFAVSLLKMSDLSVKQVADQSGFNSAAYFSNAFKDSFGISPEQFRKSNLRTVSPVRSIEKEL